MQHAITKYLPERVTSWRAMAARPVLIAQISDLHITPPGVLAYGRVDTAAALTRSIAALNRLSPRPDLVVISGDVAESGLPEEYDRAKALLADLHIPYAVIPGNHDHQCHLKGATPCLSSLFSFCINASVTQFTEVDFDDVKFGGPPAC